MTWDLHDFRLVTISAYPGMLAPLTTHPSTVCVLSGDADNDGGLRTGAAVRSLESVAGLRRRWRLGDVAGLAEFVPKVLSRGRRDHRPIILVAPRANHAWETACAGWPKDLQLASRVGHDLNDVAEDKAYVRQQLERLDLPVPASVVIAAAEIQFGRVAAAIGLPFVLQAPNSAGGQGTYLVDGEPALRALLSSRADVERWLASAYAGDLTINVPGVVYEDGWRVLPASVQSSAIPHLGVGFGAYCGSDFGAVRGLSSTMLAEAYRCTARIGAWLHRGGHRGLFGADIAVNGNDIAFLEVNPRIQGSSWLLDKLLTRNGYGGCLENHVEALHGRGAPDAGEVPTLIVGGSHVLVRWSGPTGVVCSVPASGVRHSAAHQRAVTVTGLPAIGTVLMPGAIVARIEADFSLCATSGTELTGPTMKLVDDMLANVEVTTQSV